jgi:hypothetical protein
MRASVALSAGGLLREAAFHAMDAHRALCMQISRLFRALSLRVQLGLAPIALTPCVREFRLPPMHCRNRVPIGVVSESTRRGFFSIKYAQGAY